MFSILHLPLSECFNVDVLLRLPTQSPRWWPIISMNLLIQCTRTKSFDFSINAPIERAQSCHFPSCLCHLNNLIGQSEWFWRMSQTRQDAANHNELQQQHVRHGGVGLGLRLVVLLVFLKAFIFIMYPICKMLRIGIFVVVVIP